MTGGDAVAAMLGSLDEMDVDGYVSHFADDATFRFGNYEAVHGPKEIAETCRNFLETIDGLRHDVLERWDIDDATVLRIKIHYVRKDARTVTIPLAIILKWGEGLVTDYQIYADVAPVFEP